MKVAFADFVFDLDRRELTRAGEPLPLSPKAFQLLHTLIERAPAAVSKQELYKSLWGEGFVEEANLANLVSELRGALGDERKRARFISTLHGFGYRFEAAPRPLDAPSGVRHRLVWGEREILLRVGENVLGRDESAPAVIDSAGVSRRHARIVVAGEEALIEDMGSKNGTFVDEERVLAPLALRDGQVVRLGSVALTYHVSRAADTTLTEHVDAG